MGQFYPTLVGLILASVTPSGDNYIIIPFDIYGSGVEFVINNNYIWLISNNGADGDNWSKNNIATGGAGAVGYRLPYDESIANRIKAVIV